MNEFIFKNYGGQGLDYELKSYSFSCKVIYGYSKDEKEKEFTNLTDAIEFYNKLTPEKDFSKAVWVYDPVIPELLDCKVSIKKKVTKWMNLLK